MPKLKRNENKIFGINSKNDDETLVYTIKGGDPPFIEYLVTVRCNALVYIDPTASLLQHDIAPAEVGSHYSSIQMGNKRIYTINPLFPKQILPERG